MDNNKDDKYFEKKIIESIDIINKYMKEKTKDDLENDILLNNTVMFQLICISENINKLSDRYKQKKSGIVWNQIKGIRNIIVHNYDGVNYKTIFDTVIDDLSVLKKELCE